MCGDMEERDAGRLVSWEARKLGGTRVIELLEFIGFVELERLGSWKAGKRKAKQLGGWAECP